MTAAIVGLLAAAAAGPLLLTAQITSPAQRAETRSSAETQLTAR